MNFINFLRNIIKLKDIDFNFIYNKLKRIEYIDSKLSKDSAIKSEISLKAKVYSPFYIEKSSIGDYSYVSKNSSISNVLIGKFCSIGPKFLAGWGIHPTDMFSTSPMFYSTRKQNGFTLVEKDLVIERKQIIIGNDVFIGANVTILDGVKIGDGVIIGAGSIIAKDIPPYAIVVGNPCRVIRYRFNEDQIENFLNEKWWDNDIEDIKKKYII